MKKFQYLILGFVLIALLLFILTISKTARAITLIAFFIGINSIIASYKRFIKLPIEIEALTLGIVVCTLKFGIKAGLVVAILGGILGFFVGYNISPFSFPMLLGYILIAITSFFLNWLNLGIIFIGIISSIVNNIFVFLFYHYVFNYDITKNILFSLSNIILNIILFVNVAIYFT